MDFYDFERIEFLLETVNAASVGNELVERQLKLLRRIQSYTRCSPPSDFERTCRTQYDEDKMMLSKPVTSPLAATRLPFHVLLGEHPFRIICSWFTASMLCCVYLT